MFESIRKFLTYILNSNIPELVPYLAFVLFRIPLPLTIIQMPRARAERLLSWGLMARAYLFLGMLQAAAAMAVFFFVLNAAGWQYGTSLDRNDPLYLQATPSSPCWA